MGGDGGDAKGLGGVPPPVFQADHWYDGNTWSGGEWEYPPVAEALEYAELNPIMEYIRRRKAAILENLEYCPIYELCIDAEQRPEKIQSMRWWDQDIMNESVE